MDIEVCNVNEPVELHDADNDLDDDHSDDSSDDDDVESTKMNDKRVTKELNQKNRDHKYYIPVLKNDYMEINDLHFLCRRKLIDSSKRIYEGVEKKHGKERRFSRYVFVPPRDVIEVNISDGHRKIWRGDIDYKFHKIIRREESMTMRYDAFLNKIEDAFRYSDEPINESNPELFVIVKYEEEGKPMKRMTTSASENVQLLSTNVLHNEDEATIDHTISIGLNHDNEFVNNEIMSTNDHQITTVTETNTLIQDVDITVVQVNDHANTINSDNHDGATVQENVNSEVVNEPLNVVELPINRKENENNDDDDDDEIFIEVRSFQLDGKSTAYMCPCRLQLVDMSLKEFHHHSQSILLEIFCNYGRVGDINKAKLFYGKYHSKFNVDGKLDDSDWNCLQYACYGGYLDFVLWLVCDIRANPTIKSKNGWHALHCCASRCHLDVIKFLINIDPNLSLEDKTVDGESPRSMLVKQKRTDILVDLLNEESEYVLRQKILHGERNKQPTGRMYDILPPFEMLPVTVIR